jgi:sterol desaturase/sphingolipid hydroxylase (fatty acid hydroxylase superfamily)
MIVVTLLLGLFVAERYFPAAVMPSAIKAQNRIARNLSLWLCNSLVSAFIVLPVTFLAVGWGISWRSVVLSEGWGGLLVNVLILDLWIYWWHRANHRVPFFWRFHQVHHLDEWLDVTSAVRFHFGEVIMSALVRSLVIVCLGIPLLSVIIFEAIVLINAGFHHSNVRLPVALERILSRVIITPSIHWMHHHSIQQDTDSNYGTILSIWDRLFDSRSKHTRQPEMKIGLEHRHDESLVQLMLEPFKSIK